MDVFLRRPLLSIFVVALLARSLVVLISTFAFEGWTIDDETYSLLAETRADGTHEALWGPYEYVLFQKTLAFLGPLTLIYKIFGPIPPLGQFFVALTGSLAAVGVGYLALRLLPTSFAFFAGLVVALLPSQVFWSSVLLKDAVVWALLIGTAVAVWHFFKGEGWSWVLALVAAGAFMLALGHAREHTLVITVVALSATSTIVLKRVGTQRWISAIAMAGAVPWLVGIGVFGHDLVLNAGSLEARRLANAAGAETALVEPPASADGDGEKAEGPLERCAPGVEDESESPVNPDVAHLPRGVFALLLEPTPWGWDDDDSPSLRVARLESLLWYPLLMLAAAGIPSILRSKEVLLFPCLVGAGVLLVYALTEGNIGTAYRHRGEFVWVVALLAAAGLDRIVARRREATSPGSRAAKGGHRA